MGNQLSDLSNFKMEVPTLEGGILAAIEIVFVDCVRL